MTDINPNKRPSDDSSVGSASKKLTMEKSDSPTKEHMINMQEGHQENFRYDTEEERWIVRNISKVTEEGDKLLGKTGNRIEPIIEGEWEDTEQMCKTRSHHLDTSLKDPDSLDKWAEEFKKLPKLTRTRLKTHPSAMIAKRMMGTQIEDIPMALNKDNRWLLPVTHVSVAWMACAKILGVKKPAKMATCYDNQNFRITEKGRELKTNEEEIKGFIKGEVLQEGEKGAHDLCQWAIRTGHGSQVSVDPWNHFCHQIWNKPDKSEQEEKMVDLIKRLANTAPENMPGWNGKLPTNVTNLAWLAAQKTLGSLWKVRKDDQMDNLMTTKAKAHNWEKEQIVQLKNQGKSTIIDTSRNLRNDLLAEADSKEGNSKEEKEYQSNRTPPSIIKKGKFGSNERKPNNSKNNKVGFSEQTRSKKQPTANPYLKNLNKANQETSKAFAKQLKTGKKTKKGPEQKTLLRVRVPIQIDSIKDWNDAIQDTVEYLRTIWKALLRVDPQNTSIEGWKDPRDNRKCPRSITNENQIPLTKTKIDEKYVEKMKLSWSSSKQDTELRMILGHKRPIRVYMDNDDLNNRLTGIKAEILVDRVQAEKTAIAGYLAGPVVTEATAFNLASIILEKKLCIMNGVAQLDIREELINIRQEKSKYRSKKSSRKPKAMHVIVPYKDKAQARACLSKLFPSKVRGDYPLGIQFRFVPNTADTDFSVSPKARTIASRLSNKQAGFLAANMERENNHIRNIYANIQAMPNVTMSGVLMALRSRTHPDRQLFTCIQQEYEEGPVTFQYLTQFEQEADAIIPVLPLFLAGVLGAEATKWFKPSAEMGTEGYEFDGKLNRVIPSKSNMLINLDQDWEQEMDQWNSDESLSDPDSEDDMEGFAIEFGKIDFDDNLRASNLGDDSGSLGTLGMPSPKGFVIPGTSEREGHHKEDEIVMIDHEEGSDSSDTSMENMDNSQTTASLKQGEGGDTT